MRILHVEASSGWGGQEMRILREAEGMRSRGHHIVFAVMKQGKLIEKAKETGFTVYELNFYKIAWVSTLFQLLWIIKKHQIERVNTHSSLDSWIGGLAARLSRKKVVRTRHLSGAVRAGLNSRILYGFLADSVVTTCKQAATLIGQQSGASCRSIPTGLDPKAIAFDPEERKLFRQRWKPDQLLVGTACFMRSWKGIEDFLKAAYLLRHVEAIRWVIIGGGHFATYKQKAEELGLEGIVHFTGHLENPYPAMAALDVFALVSTANEGVSQAILQAAYLEKPLIATATGGLREVCIPSLTGIRVDPFSPDQIAEAVSTLEKDPALRDRLGKQGKKLVEEQFSFEKMLDQMEEVFLS